ATGCRVLLGCSGQGIIGGQREIEDRPAISVLSLNLPGARLQPLYLDQAMLEAAEDGPSLWQHAAGEVAGTPAASGARGVPDGDPAVEDVSACVLFADPFHLDCEGVLASFNAAFSGVPMVGGLASSSVPEQRTYLFLNDAVYDRGAVAVAVSGCAVRTVVSQGADPIGEPWMVTAAQGPVVETIAQRPAYTVLTETVQALPREAQQRASRNLLVGLAIDEYKESWGRGDFLIRNLTGADPSSGALAVSASPRPGQTIQFQVRDARAADEDLKQLLAEARESLGSVSPAGVLLCSCNGRGQGLFGVPDHDARTLAEQFGPVPVAGFFCNGEVGPIGKRNFLHGFTASLALIVPK
ncbi:MAG: FIST signal transduction protein, partial [Chloroflexota bacterium]